MTSPRLFQALLFALLTSAVPAAHAQVRIEGSVQDERTGAPLPGAHVSVSGTAPGTTTDVAGTFLLDVPSLPVLLVVTYVGYEARRVTVERAPSAPLRIALKRATIELGEVVVLDEDFVDGLMRRVIARKRRWEAHARTYAAEGYSKLVLERNGRIVLLSETVFDAYWDRERGPREVVRSRRRTSDFHGALPLPDAGHVPNLYDDTVPLQGLAFIGPTHPDALAHYTFTLAGRRQVEGRTVYDLYVAPKNDLQATFVGMISVLEGAYAMLRADLRPGPHVTFPRPVERWQVSYVQDFEAADSVWLPTELHMEGGFTVYADDLRTRSGTLSRTALLKGHRVNAALPEAPYRQAERVTEDAASVRRDDLFLLGRALHTLSPREAEALEHLKARPLTLEEAFPPERRSGFLAAFMGEDGPGAGLRLTWPTILGYQFRFRYNRVDGLLSSVGQVLPFSPRLRLEWRLGEATGLSRIRAFVGARYGVGPRGFVEASYGRDVEPRHQASLYPPALVSLPFLLGGDDYFDFFWNERVRLGGGVLFERAQVAAGVSHERHEAVPRAVDRALPFRQVPRTNPEVEEGTLRTLSASIALGEGRQEAPEAGLRRLLLSLEGSTPAFGSAFSYGRGEIHIDARLPTFFRARPRPNKLDVLVGAAGSAGTLPLQRFGVLDGSLGPFGPFGTFRSVRGRPVEGKHHLGIFWEHDFKTVPFELLRLWPLVRTGTGLTLGGAHGRTWIGAARLRSLSYAPLYQDAFHHELTLSLTHLLGSPLRLDLTYRLDQPGVFFGFGLSSRVLR